MISQYIPPPEPVPADYRTIDANDRQRTESPFQNEIENFNPDGSAPVINIEQAKESQPDNKQQIQDIDNNVNGIGEAAGGLAKAKNEAEQKKEEDAAITANKDVAAGSGGEPPHNPEEKAEKNQSENKEQSAGSAPGEDNGYDYYSGYGYQ